MSAMRWGYRTIIRTTAGAVNFDGAAGATDPGRITVNNFVPDFAKDLFVPFCSVSYSSGFTRGVLAEFVDDNPEYNSPTTGPPSQNRKVIFRETDTTILTDFIEDNLGQGWPIPFKFNEDNPYEFYFTTTGAAGGGDNRQVLIFEYWYELAPRGGDFFRKACGALEKVGRFFDKADRIVPGDAVDPRRGGYTPAGMGPGPDPGIGGGGGPGYGGGLSGGG